LTKGSGKAYIQQQIFNVFKFCREHGLYLTPIHVRREDDRIQKADAGSRVSVADDWGVDFAMFKEFHSLWQFTLDPFASRASHRVPRYFSYLWDQDSLGMDAMCHSWSGESIWLCPPVSLMIGVLRKLRKTRDVKGVLVTPAWKSANYWPQLFEGDQLREPFVACVRRRPYIVQYGRVTDTALFGITDFDILFLSFINK